jgi:uncharacterized protein YndB with AHSA1/START domain
MTNGFSILHDFPINVPPGRVFAAVSTPEGLDRWWTQRSAGRPVEGAEYELGFGPEYDWRATVSRSVPDREFELTMGRSDADWQGSRVRFELTAVPGGTRVRFAHTGWPAANDHYRTSCYCWAMYLRILTRNLEYGEEVPYEKRLSV